MKKRLTIYITILLSVLLTSSCKTRPDEVDFMVLYTSQMYGNVLPWDFKNDTVNQVSMANFMSLVREQRAIYGNRCIVLDNGNMHTRGLANFYWRYIDTECEPLTYKAQRYIGYDAVALGHSDMRLSEPFTASRHDVSKCPPTICANVIDRKTDSPYFQPWICIEREGVRIAIFALVEEQADGWTPQLGDADAECRDMISTMRQQILDIRHECNPDIVIGLVSSPRDLEELRIQEQIPGIDHLININIVKQGNLRYAGMLRMHLTRDEATDSYTMHSLTNAVDLSQYEIDQDYSDFFDEDLQRMRNKYKESFGQLPDTIWTPYGIYSPHDFYRDILHKAQLYYTDADISIANIANDNATIMPGAVDIKVLSELFNHENVLVSMNMKGYEVKRMLESFYALQYNQMKSVNDPLLAVRHDKKGHLMYNAEGMPYLNVPPALFASAAGINYSIDLQRTPGNRVTIQSMEDGRAFYADSDYMVTTNSFIASKMDSLEYLNWNTKEVQSRLLKHDTPSILYVLYKYFRDYPGAYTPPARFNCDFIPNEWWRIAKTRERQDLNPTW